jgi:hypothetical protein
MAVVQNFSNTQDDNQQQQQGQNQFVNAPINISGSSSSSASGGAYGSSAAPTVSDKGTSSGRYTNLRSYLDANKDFNKQNGGLAGQITNNVQNQANAIQNQAQQSQQDFQKQAEQSRNQYNPDLVNQALTDPTKFTQNQQNVSGIQSLLNNQYQGPTALSNQQQLLGQAQQLESNANLVNTEAGRYALLNKMYGNPGYSQGQQKLDNLLLQSNPEQLQQLQKINPLATNLNSNVQNVINQAQQQGQQYQQEAQQTQQQTGSALQNAINSLMTQGQTAQEAAKNAELARTTALNSFSNNLASGDYKSALNALASSGYLSKDDANAIVEAARDVAPNYKNQLPNILGQAVQAKAASGLDTMANFLNSNQVSNLNALNTLLGTGASYNPDSYKAGNLNINTQQILDALAPYMTKMEATPNTTKTIVGDAPIFYKPNYSTLPSSAR